MFCSCKKSEVRNLVTKDEVIEKIKAAASAEDLENVKGMIDALKPSMQAPAEKAQ